ncbi:MAG TPA: hypothetical protein VM493_02035 [Vicinamibacterales bacterium]|nr:hypothetical protein [Vicinamibacterales bacterium]
MRRRNRQADTVGMKRIWLGFAILTLGLGTVLPGAGQKFYRDDPIWRDPETQDASVARSIPVNQQYDFVENTFLGAGDEDARRAVNINTIDEVPDSSWFTNRIGRHRWTTEQLVRGPDTSNGPAAGPWTIIGAKSEGVTPGLTIRDTAGDTYFIKFDPPSNPEMASGAEVISTKFFYAFGYHTPENYLATIGRDALVIGSQTLVTDRDGKKRPFIERDLDTLLKKAARRPDGGYRVIASKALPGRPLGHYRYYGTRPDDPNDIFPHEHRRELRGLSVFAAWLNHDDSRSINTLDVLVQEGSRSTIKHYLLDFGSTLGSGSTREQTTRAGNEYVWEARPTLVTMLTLGLYVRPWVKVDYPKLPAVGRFESTYFRPENWKPEYPNPAFRNARPEDRFWAARIIAQISDEAVKAIVATAKYSDPKSTEYMTETILARKAKVLNSWLNGSNPAVDFAMDQDGRLTFQNAAVEVGVAKEATRYSIAWSRFDNAAAVHTAVGGEQSVTTPAAQAPRELLASDFVSATIRAFHPDHPAWQQPVVIYFRRGPDSTWTLVGLERNP